MFMRIGLLLILAVTLAQTLSVRPCPRNREVVLYRRVINRLRALRLWPDIKVLCKRWCRYGNVYCRKLCPGHVHKPCRGKCPRHGHGYGKGHGQGIGIGDGFGHGFPDVGGAN